MLALSLRDSVQLCFLALFFGCWCGLLLGRNMLSIPSGCLLLLARYSRGVLHGYAGVGAELLDPF